MAQLRNLQYRRNYRKAPFYWEIFGRSDDGEIGMLVSLAEREELGSNLLRVAQSSLGDPGGLGSFGKGGRRTQRPRSDRRWLYRRTSCRARQPANR
jgi:hypothetical protein